MPKKHINRIELNAGVISYTSAPQASWTLRVEDLRVLGEATNEDGPFADDYFICFGLNSTTWLEASFYSEGMQEFLIDLQAYLSASFMLNLQGSTSFDNVILWPEHLAGQAMFDYHVAEPKNVIAKLVSFIVGPPAPQTLYSKVSLIELRDSGQE